MQPKKAAQCCNRGAKLLRENRGFLALDAPSRQNQRYPGDLFNPNQTRWRPFLETTFACRWTPRLNWQLPGTRKELARFRVSVSSSCSSPSSCPRLLAPLCIVSMHLAMIKQKVCCQGKQLTDGPKARRRERSKRKREKRRNVDINQLLLLIGGVPGFTGESNHI